jgi:cell division protein FtsI/penicillin-binding protein 2
MIKRNIPFKEGELLRSMANERGLRGLFLRETEKRVYPKGPLLAPTLGIVNVDKEQAIPVSGVEKAFAKEMAAVSGKVVLERDRRGRPIVHGKKIVEDTAADGADIFLTIDSNIQMIVEDELERMCGEFNPKAAYAVMVDPDTGDIMALAQRPTFNPNDRSTIKNRNWLNRITTDIFEPGSTMKPIVISSALDYGVVTPNTKFDCEHGYWKEMKLRDAHRMGVSSVTEILVESSNIGTAKIAVAMGKPLLYKTLVRFGIGEKTGAPLRPEARGVLRRYDKWDHLSISRFPIGQGVAVTPLQLVRAYCALANGGRLVKLRLLDRLRNTATGKIEKKPFEPARLVFRHPWAQRQIVEMMRHVTKHGGTAERAAIKGREVAGKTGTSQKWIPAAKSETGKGHYSEKRFFATFVGFVPAENPAFVLAIIADEPKGNHYGGVVAAPTFKRIAEKTLAYLHVPATLPTKTNTRKRR